MTATTFLVMYLVGGAFAWVAWSIFFFMARGSTFFNSSFFGNLADYLGGSGAMLTLWPFAILYFIFTALFSKTSV